MITLSPILFTLVLGALAIASVVLSRVALRAHGRVRRVATRKIGELSPGPGEVVGRARALGPPPMTVRGEAVIVLRTELETVRRSGSKTHHNPWAYDGTAAVPIELHDPSGTLAIEVDHVLPVAERRLTTFTAPELAARFPQLWQALGSPEGVTEVRVRETFVSGDGDVFAAGDTVPTGQSVSGGDYRDARGTLRLRGTPEHPLILSAWGEADVRRFLLQPAWLLTATALLAAAIIAVLWGARVLILHAAGL